MLEVITFFSELIVLFKCYMALKMCSICSYTKYLCSFMFLLYVHKVFVKWYPFNILL